MSISTQKRSWSKSQCALRPTRMLRLLPAANQGSTGGEIPVNRMGMEVCPSQIIHRMMGGDLFMQSTGMQRVITTTRCITYKLPANNSLATHVSISVNDAGLYSLQFFTNQGSITLATNTYIDRDLSSIPHTFRQVTGLRL